MGPRGSPVPTDTHSGKTLAAAAQIPPRSFASLRIAGGICPTRRFRRQMLASLTFANENVASGGKNRKEKTITNLGVLLNSSSRSSRLRRELRCFEGMRLPQFPGW